MSVLTPQFSANRAVREYTEQHYLPAAANYLQRAKENGAAGNRIVNIRQQLSNNWHKIVFGRLQPEAVENGFNFKVQISLKGINPSSVLVELYAEGINKAAPERIRMESTTLDGVKAEYLFHAKVLTTRPANDFTPRVIPAYEGVCVPLEDQSILWAH